MSASMPPPIEPNDPDLDDFIALLRSGTPDPATLQDARAALIATVGGAPTAAPHAKLTLGGALKASTIGLFALVAIGGLIAMPDLSTEALPTSKIASEDKEEMWFALEEIDAAMRRENPILAPIEAPLPRIEGPAPLATRDVVTRRDEVREIPTDVTESDNARHIARRGPSVTLRGARRAYEEDRFAAALSGFVEVAEGRSDDSAIDVASAELARAKCLYHLGLYNAARAAFAQIAGAGSSHPHFREVPTWIVMVSHHLPDMSGSASAVAPYELEDLGPPELAHPARLDYLLGRARYEAGRLDDAIRLFRNVPDDAEDTLEARFFEGLCHVRARNVAAAQRAFRRMLRLVDEGRTGSHPDPANARRLALLNIARVDYTSAMALPAAQHARRAALLGQAEEAWAALPPSTSLGRTAMAERAWALFVLGRYDEALGVVHAFEAPALRDKADPELLVLESLIELRHCQWDAAEDTVRTFHTRYDPLLDAAEATERMARSTQDTLRLLVAVRANRSRVPAAIRARVRSVLDTPELTRAVRQLESIRAERRSLVGLDDASRAYLDGLLASEEESAIRNASELTASRLHVLADEIREHVSEIDTVELEVSRGERRELARGVVPEEGPREGDRIFAQQDGVRWPFDGEFWPDEVTQYRRTIEDRCR